MGAAALLALTILALCAGVAHAYVVQGRPWPGRVITYHNDLPVDAAAVVAAVHDWNTSGVAIRFLATTAAQAEVTISAMPGKLPGAGSRGTSADTLGYATVGMVPRHAQVASPSGASTLHGAHVWLVRIGTRDAFGMPITLGLMKRVAVHELGHVLGLGHELHACAVMEPSVNQGCAVAKQPWMGLCPDPLEPDDIRGAVALYGGREPSGGRRLCSLSRRPPAPGALSTRLTDRAASIVTLSWRNPSGLTLPVGRFDPFSLDGRTTVEYAEVEASPHGCARANMHPETGEAAHAGARMASRLSLSTGSWCLGVRVRDAFGRWSPLRTIRTNVPTPVVTVPPTVRFSTDPAQPVAGATTTFLDGSSAGSAPITGWNWSFGDGSSSSAQDPQHIYANPGTYLVTLTVTDADGGSAALSEKLVVSA